MRLFDESSHTETGPKTESEPIFDYYNRSARPAVKLLREILELWFERYPSEERKNLRERFRSPKESNHLGAFFELYVHELFARMGFELRAHPPVQSASHPDFVACSRGEDNFYIEATIAGSPSETEQGEKARMSIVYDAINSIESPNFFLELEIIGAPNTPPPTRRLRRDLTKWLASLNPDHIALLHVDNKRSDIPTLPWSHDGWNLLFRPRPKSPKLRGRPGVRPIGLRLPEGGWLNTGFEIRRAIETKCEKYGELERPLVIAVNYIGFHCDNIDVMNALYGQESVLITLAPDGSYTERNQRKPNGVWLGKDGPRKNATSGVLIANQLNPWSLGSETPELFHNPWASRPLPQSLLCIPQCIADLSVGQVRHEAGRQAGEILGIPTPWPVPYEY